MIVFVNNQQIDIHYRARLRDVILKYCTINGIDYSETVQIHDQWGNEVMHSGPATKNGKYFITL